MRAPGVPFFLRTCVNFRPANRTRGGHKQRPLRNERMNGRNDEARALIAFYFAVYIQCARQRRRKHVEFIAGKLRLSKAIDSNVTLI